MAGAYVDEMVRLVALPREVQTPPLSALYAAAHFREKVMFIRSTLCISQTELARRLGVEHSQIWDWENLRYTPKDLYLILAVTEWESKLKAIVK